MEDDYKDGYEDWFIRGIEEVHYLNPVSRDLKPTPVLLFDKEIKLIDFRSSKITDDFCLGKLISKYLFCGILNYGDPGCQKTVTLPNPADITYVIQESE